MTARDTESHSNRWRSRPLLSLSLRLLSIMVPAVAGAMAAIVVGRLLPRPDGAARWVWLLGLVVVAWIAAAVVERLARHVLPLAVLLRLSLVFPDAAPSRFKLARGNGNIRVLEARIREAKERGLDDDPARAAAQILSLVAALSQHDRKTRGHSERVRAFTDLIADELKIPQGTRDRIRWASLLHDIGKLEVPARVLNKPGTPTETEWEVLKQHPEMGARIAAPLLPWLGESADAIAQHHERHDGAGYPNGLHGDEISLVAKIVSVADSFEVMTSARTYKKPMSVAAAREELALCAGAQFAPEIVRAFFNISIGRLWWTVGPAAWIALLPFLGQLQRAGGQAIVAAKSTAVAASVGAASLLGLTPVAASPASGPGAPAASTSALPSTDGSPDGWLNTGSGGHGHGGGDDDDGQGGGGGSAPGGGDGGPADTSGDPGGSGGGSGSGSGGGSGSDPGSSGITETVEDLIDTGTGAVDDILPGTGDTIGDVVDDVTGGLLP